MHLGKGIKEAATLKLLAKMGAELPVSETVVLVCKCNNFKPMVDRLLVTEQRLLAVSATDAKVKWQVDRGEVTTVVVESSWSGSSLVVTSADGRSLTFKQLDVVDADAVAAQLQASVLAHLPPPGHAPEAQETADVERSTGATGMGVLAKAKKVYSDAQAATRELEERNRSMFGNLVQKAEFGAQTVEIYDGGFVRVGMFLTAKSSFERLVSIRLATQVQDKSAGGRALAAGVTMGLSTFTSNEKRLLFLTLATDRKVHTLQAEGGMGRSEDKAGLALEAAGNAVLDAHRQPHVGQPAVAQAPPAAVGDQLRELAELHQHGILSDEEFAGAKAKLLDKL